MISPAVPIGRCTGHDITTDFRSLAEIVNRLSAEDKEKLKSLSKEEKADLRRLKSLEDIEAFLALC